MPFFIKPEEYCEVCGLPLDQCECLGKDDDGDLEDLEDEDCL
jgi:hypothetical protein